MERFETAADASLLGCRHAGATASARMVGLMTQLGRNQARSVSKGPSRRLAAHDFTPQKTCVRSVDC